MTQTTEHRSRRFVRNVAWNWLSSGIALITGVFLSPFLIHKLGPEGYGVWTLSFALVEYYWLLDLGFRSAVVKFVAHYAATDDQAGINRVVNTALAYGLGMAAVIMSLVMAMAISINVRERRTEMAVLKVLGFSPGRILAIVLGEALVVGVLSGLISAALSYGLVHGVMGGIPFQIAFFAVWDILPDALWWGILFGAVTSLLGSIVPAWGARNVKVSEVFAKVA